MNRSQKIGIVIISISVLLTIFTLIIADWNGIGISPKQTYFESFLNGTAAIELHSSTIEFSGWNECLLCESKLAIYYFMLPIKYVLFVLLAIIIYGMLLAANIITFLFKIS